MPLLHNVGGYFPIFVLFLGCFSVLLMGVYGYRGDVHVSITGSTGVIGTALSHRLFHRWHKLAQQNVESHLNLHLMHRDHRKLNRMLENLSATRKEADSAVTVFHSHCDFQTDVNTMPETEVVLKKLFSPNACRQHVLINCAGVHCLGQTYETMKQSFLCNTISAITLTKRFINLYQTQSMTSSMDLPSLEIINISSGDGESVNIHSEINRRLRDTVHTVDELALYMNELIESFNAKYEYAFGMSPMYSLSKRLLNKATELFHHQYGDESVKFIACCPGNVLSPMTTEDEKDTVNDGNVAADYIIDSIGVFAKGLERSIYPYQSGKFYRFAREIQW
jgi:NAD(P)-dependent dehydrogenase (short-subunit alcohol dehydrogenase family)